MKQTKLKKYPNTTKLDVFTENKLIESQQLIYEVLEHLSAGRFNVDLMKQKLIQASKNLPLIQHFDMSKYN